jgi:Ubiquitin fusion degradation protein UFD1/Amino-terminal Zinc-binding domain of ubiquitin ligase E3A
LQDHNTILFVDPLIEILIMTTDDHAQPLSWSASLTVAPASRTPHLSGDKLLLPQSALEQLLAAAPVVDSDLDSSIPYTSTFDPFNPHTYAAERTARHQFRETQPQLPHPLTFRLVNPENNHVVYAGIREFSAEEGVVVLSNSLRASLGIKDDDVFKEPNGDASEDTEISNGAHVDTGSRITVVAQQLPKGTFVKLRPLEAGYDAEDWKALLEQHMRSNYTTLTNGEILTIPGGRGMGTASQVFQFLVDGFQPEGDGICIVDTDLEVDIEALNEEQARETLKRIAAKSHRTSSAGEGSSAGGRIDLFQSLSGQVVDGEFVDYELPSWDRSQGIEIELSGVGDEVELDMYASPLGPRQRSSPRPDEYVFAQTEGRYPRRIRVQPTNSELDGAESIRISIHAFAEPDSSPSISPTPFSIQVGPFDPTVTSHSESDPDSEIAPNPDESRCKNCHQWIPQRTMMLHENFCYRNNILCPRGCNQVFQKRSPEWQSHWHCPHDSSWGNTALSHIKHDLYGHTPQTCPSCNRTYQSLSALAKHRTTVCPGKLVLCQFCHLQVPQEGDPDEPNPEAILSGLTPHELADGARTTECHLCGKIVRLRDMRTHLAHHELQKTSRLAPRICRNVLCGRTLDGTSKQGGTRAGSSAHLNNDMGLCAKCFGPLYVAIHDPDGRALKRRIERRYLSQLLTGCGKPWCRNEFCKTGRKNGGLPERGSSAKDALPLIKPVLEQLGGGGAVHFCVDEASQQRRSMAEHLAAEGVYDF